MLPVVVNAGLLVRTPEATFRVAVFGEESVREPHFARPTQPVLTSCRPEVSAIRFIAVVLAVLRVHARRG